MSHSNGSFINVLYGYIFHYNNYIFAAHFQFFLQMLNDTTVSCKKMSILWYPILARFVFEKKNVALRYLKVDFSSFSFTQCALKNAQKKNLF